MHDRPQRPRHRSRRPLLERPREVALPQFCFVATFQGNPGLYSPRRRGPPASETKIGNLTKNLAKEGTLERAEAEINGGMKVIREDGKLFDHADFVRKQIGGLEKQAKHLERFIQEHPGLSDSQKERAISAIRFARDTAGAARTFITPKDPI